MGSARSAGEVGGVSLIGVTQFCNALHCATLRGPRDEQSAEGEVLWELYDELRKRFPTRSGTIVQLPKRTVEEVATTIRELFVRGGIPCDYDFVPGLAVLTRRLTASGVPKEIAE